MPLLGVADSSMTKLGSRRFTDRTNSSLAFRLAAP